MSCFFHVVAPNRKQKAPGASPKPQAPGPELAAPQPRWGSITPGAGCQPCPHEDVGPAVVALLPLFLWHGYGHCKRKMMLPLHLPPSSFSVGRRYKLVELVCYVIMGFFPALVILSMVSHRWDACGLSARDKSSGLARSRLCDA